VLIVLRVGFRVLHLARGLLGSSFLADRALGLVAFFSAAEALLFFSAFGALGLVAFFSALRASGLVDFIILMGKARTF
jgi:hypothetical protein